MGNDCMLAGPRPRSKIHSALRTAFNAFAVAALLTCIGVALRDLVHSQIWYQRFWYVAEMMVVIGLTRIACALVGAVCRGLRRRRENRIARKDER